MDTFEDGDLTDEHKDFMRRKAQFLRMSRGESDHQMQDIRDYRMSTNKSSSPRKTINVARAHSLSPVKGNPRNHEEVLLKKPQRPASLSRESSFDKDLPLREPDLCYVADEAIQTSLAESDANSNKLFRVEYFSRGSNKKEKDLEVSRNHEDEVEIARLSKKVIDLEVSRKTKNEVQEGSESEETSSSEAIEVGLRKKMTQEQELFLLKNMTGHNYLQKVELIQELEDKIKVLANRNFELNEENAKKQMEIAKLHIEKEALANSLSTTKTKLRKEISESQAIKLAISKLRCPQCHKSFNLALHQPVILICQHTLCSNCKTSNTNAEGVYCISCNRRVPSNNQKLNSALMELLTYK